MNDEIHHNEYIEIYKELVDTINHKEDIIQAMTHYIARYTQKHYTMCTLCKNRKTKCEHEECIKSIRNYFERWN